MEILVVFGGFYQEKQTQFRLAPSTAGDLRTNLKKQSQSFDFAQDRFVSGQIDARFY